MAEIAKKSNCSINKVTYWMSKHGIKRRSRSEAGYIKLNPEGDPFLIKKNLTKEEKFLYGLGLGIYWGEGEKASRNTVRVANTDPYLIIAFKKFLLEICQLKEQKLTYSIVCFNDTSPENAKNYWSKILKTSKEKFGKIVQVSIQGKGKYKRKSEFGVCTVTASNIKLKAWIMDEIETLKQMPG